MTRRLRIVLVIVAGAALSSFATLYAQRTAGFSQPSRTMESVNAR